MNNPESQQIVERFFSALQTIISLKIIRGKQTFCREHGIDRRNFRYVEMNPSSGMFQPAWLAYLVRDFNVSSQWLLTGHGSMFKAGVELR